MHPNNCTMRITVEVICDETGEPVYSNSHVLHGVTPAQRKMAESHYVGGFLLNLQELDSVGESKKKKAKKSKK